MDLFDELENLAVTATYDVRSEQNGVSDYPAQGTIKMWQDRFGYIYDQSAGLFLITSWLIPSDRPAGVRTVPPLPLRQTLPRHHYLTQQTHPMESILPQAPPQWLPATASYQHKHASLALPLPQHQAYI